MTGKAGRGADQFMLRLPEGLRDRIKKNADFNMRSMNAEIIATLLNVYPEPRDPDAEKLADLLHLLPKEAQEEFIKKWLEENVSDADISDGLIPGVSLRKDAT